MTPFLHIYHRQFCSSNGVPGKAREGERKPICKDVKDTLLKWDRCPILLPFPFCFINIKSCFDKTRYEPSACAENISLCYIEFSELWCCCLLSNMLWRGQIRLMKHRFDERLCCLSWNKTKAPLSLNRFGFLGSFPSTSNQSTWRTASSGMTGEYILDRVMDAKRHDSFSIYRHISFITGR